MTPHGESASILKLEIGSKFPWFQKVGRPEATVESFLIITCM